MKFSFFFKFSQFCPSWNLATLSISWSCIIVKCLEELNLNKFLISQAFRPILDTKLGKFEKNENFIFQKNSWQPCLESPTRWRQNLTASPMPCPRHTHISISIILGLKTSEKISKNWGKWAIHKIKFGNPVHFLALYHFEIYLKNVCDQIAHYKLIFQAFTSILGKSGGKIENCIFFKNSWQPCEKD